MVPRICIVMWLGLITVAAAGWSGPGADAATSSTVVGATVPSATNITSTGCAPNTVGVTDLGAVLPGSAVVSSADCVVSFGSSNDTANLRVAQGDRGGWAMVPATAAATTIGQWSLNGNRLDSTVAANTLLPTTGAVTDIAGTPAYGTAGAFDGSSGLRAPYRAAYDLASSFSLDARIRCSVAQAVNAVIVVKGTNGGGQDNYELGFSSGTLRGSFSVNGGTWVRQSVPEATICTGAWRHVALVADGANSTLYVDGALAAQVPYAGTIDTQGGLNPDIRIGDDYGNMNRFVGDIDEVRIQSIAVPAAAIRSYAVGAFPDYSTSTADFATGSMFATCLESVAGVGAVAAWSLGPCTAVDAARWRKVDVTTAAAGSLAARSTTATTTTASARLRFGMRVSSTHPPGTYAAPIAFEVIAPNT